MYGVPGALHLPCLTHKPMRKKLWFLFYRQINVPQITQRNRRRGWDLNPICLSPVPTLSRETSLLWPALSKVAETPKQSAEPTLSSGPALPKAVCSWNRSRKAYPSRDRSHRSPPAPSRSVSVCCLTLN